MANWKEGFRSTLVVMATGTGKTVLFAKIIKRHFPGRTLVIAHRQELIFQARDKIRAAAGMNCEIEMGDFRASGSGGLFRRAPVVVSTIQTLTAGGDGGGRMTKFAPDDFSLIVTDEAHHATSPSYRKVFDYFLTNPNMKLLGVTATPDRADEEALGQVFESVAFDYEILDAIHDGWLVPIEQQMVEIADLDFSGIRTTAGDLNGSDLAAVMEAEKPLLGIADATMEIARDKKTLVFAASVAHAEALCGIFNRYQPGIASWVCGKTDREDRKTILGKFKRGDFRIVCNCGVLTEGFDDPGVEAVVMARPTKSRSLYSQMCGRATRPVDDIAHALNDEPHGDARKAMIAASSKPACLIVDFVGNSGKHKLVTSADILGGKVSEQAIESAIIQARNAGRPVRMDELLDEEEIKVQQEKRQAEDAARKQQIKAKAKYTATKVDPFDVLQIKPVAERGWDKGKKLSERQRGILREKMGLDPDEIPYSQAKQLIDEQFRRWEYNLCTFKQAKWLKKFGYSTDMTFEQANRTMNALASNGWKNPAVDPVPEHEIKRPWLTDGSAGPDPEPVGDEGAPTSAPEDDNVPF